MAMWAEEAKAAVAKAVVVGTSVLTLVACGTPMGGAGSATSSSVPATTTTASTATGYGVVEGIDTVPRDQAGIGLGTVAGAVVGGLLGSQVGGGSGRTAATVAGAAGGAMVGNRMQNNSRSADEVYRVAVRMDNGVVHTLVQETPPRVQVGDRIRLDSGVIVERFR
jgi:outer membrane lipoprotein SlyB